MIKQFLFSALLLVPAPVFAKTAAEASVKNPSLLKFETRKIMLGEEKITVEIAEDEAHREQGLMFRKRMRSDHGMLFIFQEAKPLGFWMKNTIIPLSIGYFDSNKRLINILEMEPEVLGLRELPTYRSTGPALYALEMNKNWFANKHIKVGDTFSFVK